MTPLRKFITRHWRRVSRAIANVVIDVGVFFVFFALLAWRAFLRCRSVTQKNNVVFGDCAGGDIHKTVPVVRCLNCGTKVRGDTGLLRCPVCSLPRLNIYEPTSR